MGLLKTKYLVILLVIFCSLKTSSQERITKTFYDSRVVNGHSVEMSQEGVLKMIIAHRFGRVNSGSYELFGLDQSTIRIGFDYGIKNWLNVGYGRSSFEKTYDGFVKIRFMQQNEKHPISIVSLSSIAVNGLHFRETSTKNQFSDRLFYTHQILIARKMSDRFSLQIMPSFVHRNLVQFSNESNDVFAIGTAARYMISKRITANIEYYAALPNQLDNIYKNSLSIGFNIETKGHVFQLHFGNSRGMIEKFFISETQGSWKNGDVHFGFNITRDFKLKGK